jgi:Zn-dependent peptidase ImmA (M78 family)
MLPTVNQEREIMAEVPVNGKVLQWARDIRGLTVANAAELLEISSDELLAYESGEKKPLVGLLRKMSARYQINFTSLLMPEPLPPRRLPTDHRTRHHKKRLSIDTLVAIEDVTEALEIFRDISSTKRSVIPKLKIGRATLREDPEEVAARERQKFGVSYEVQKSWRNHRKARIEWRKRIEERGIFSYMIALPIEELSGFSLLHDRLAAICINDNEPTEGAKTFTLLHEYCHLLLRKAGISDQNNNNNVERFCNRFAASFLIPRNLLTAFISAYLGDITFPYDFPYSDVSRLSNAFLVSNSAIALRLEETQLAPHGFYGKKKALWDIAVRPPRPMPIQGESPATLKISQVRIRIKRIGRLHASTVLEAVKRKAINSFDASQLIGMRPEFFPKIEAYLG